MNNNDETASKQHNPTDLGARPIFSGLSNEINGVCQSKALSAPVGNQRVTTGLTNLSPRTQQIVKLANEGRTQAEIALAVGVKTQWIGKVAKSLGLKLVKAKPGSKVVGNHKHLSLTHELIGQAISTYRYKHDLDFVEMQEKLLMSRGAQLQSDVGCYEYTTTDLLRIAGVLGIEPSALFLLKRTAVTWEKV